MLAVSVAYFISDEAEGNRLIRVLVSIHGAAAAALYLSALAVWGFTRAWRPWAASPFLALYLVPVFSILFALARFKGPKLLHLVQIPNLACMAYTLFIGGMAITGDWL